MVRYDNAYEPDSSYGCAVRLVQGTGLDHGLVLDLGCGYAAVAEPLRDLGFDYLGVDVDAVAVAAVRDRGISAATLDLVAPTDVLREQLATVLEGRVPAVVLALDSLEHLPCPEQVLRVVRELATDAGAMSLVVSYPNVTHYDVGANLVGGRWYRTGEGLLDRTHLQFRDERGLTAMLAGTGWQQVDVDDVVRNQSEQAIPSDSPFLRPGAPLRELLWSLRRDAGTAATVFQFVRRYVAGEVEELDLEVIADEFRDLVAVIVREPPGADGVATAQTLADLSAQRRPVAAVEVVTGDLAAAVSRQTSRWISVVDAGTRLAADWSELIESLAEEHPGKVLRVGTLGLDEPGVAALPSPLDLTAVVDPSITIELDPFDPATGVPRTTFVTGAYSVPLEVVESAGIGIGSAAPLGAELVIWIARAVQLSGLVGTDIVGIAVPPSLVRSPDPVAPFLAHALDAQPIVLPPGSAGRLAAARRRVEDGDRALAEAVRTAQEAEDRARRLADQLHRLDHDLAAEREELARLRQEHARRLSRRVLRRLRNHP
jgi:SAM-dependent methyltransferase